MLNNDKTAMDTIRFLLLSRWQALCIFPENYRTRQDTFQRPTESGTFHIIFVHTQINANRFWIIRGAMDLWFHSSNPNP